MSDCIIPEGKGKDLASAASDALGCYEGGACNPRAVARAMVKAIDQGCAERNGSDLKGSYSGAPARVLGAQLAWLLGSGIGEYPGVQDDLDTCRILAESEVTR